jgi:ribosomal protein S18 acetylase RimI-like enzyme
MSNRNETCITIRRFQSGDGDRIRELNAAAMSTTPEWIPEMPDSDLDSIQDHYLTEGSEFLVGTVDGRIVAMGAYTSPDEWKREYIDCEGLAELTRMRVDPEWHGQGFGQAIYRELAERAQGEGYRGFVLDTGAVNETACGFYEGLGFECRRELEIEYGEQTLSMVIYQKSLEG